MKTALTLILSLFALLYAGKIDHVSSSTGALQNNAGPDDSIQKVNSESTETTLLEMVRWNNIVGVKQALKDGATQSRDLGKAVKIAAINGRAQLVILLMNEKGVTPEDRGYALKMAIENGHVDSARALMGTETITQYDFGLALVMSVRKNRTEMVHLLKDADGLGVGDVDRALALIEAAKQGHQLIVLELLYARGVTNDDRIDALGEAAKHGRYDTVSILMNAQGITPQVCARMSYLARGWEQIRVAQLLKKVQIPGGSLTPQEKGRQTFSQ